MAHFPITHSEIIGHGHTGPLRRWTEGPRVFMEYLTTVTAASGTTYGIMLVKEITPSTD